ncbi:MAG: protein kinase [Akkermansia sp.]|nr:protein kinase [Akkermansia sp.]
MATDSSTEFSNKNKKPDWRRQATLVMEGDSSPFTPGARVAGDIEADVVIEVPYTIEGVCVLESMLSQGGMGTAYRGHMLDEEQSSIVLKVPDVSRESTLKLFADECAVLRELQHDNIVPFRGAGTFTYGGRELPYLMMKFIPGQSLRQLLTSRGTLPWKEVCRVLEDMLSALDCLHERELCHRDIKPDNIIFDEETGRWVLVDFGIAKSVNLARLATYTVVSQDSGTWDYMAPEQLLGRSVDIRCDIYSLGKVIWELLIGTVPRAGTRLPSAAGLDVASDVDVLISRMVEHQVEARYQTPAEALQALRAGAGYIEFKDKARRGFRRVCKFGTGALVLAAAAGAAWWVGDEYSSAQLQQIADSKDYTAGQKLAKVDDAASGMMLHWGQRWLKNHRPELAKQAAKDKKLLQEQWSELKGDLSALSLDDRKLRYENFITAWVQTLGEKHEYIALLRVRLFDIRIEQMAEADVTQWKLLGEGLAALRKELADAPVAQGEWDALNAKLKKGYHDVQIEKLKKLAEEGKFVEARNLVQAVRSACGETEELKKLSEKIAAEEYSQCKKEVDELIKNDAYAIARKRAEDFRKIYPEYDVSEVESAIVYEWILYSKDIENFDEFAECVSQMKQTLSGLSRWEALKSFVSSYYSHKLVGEIGALIGKFNNNVHSSTLQTRLSHLAQHVVHCGPEHQAWLNRAINNFIAMLGQGVSADAFNYEWQRGPEELGFKKENITTYRARIQSLEVIIGYEYYKALKGENNSNPRVSVRTSAGEVLYNDEESPDAWKNKMKFTVPINKEIYFNKGEKLVVGLRDDANEWKSVPAIGCEVPLGHQGYVADIGNQCSFRLNHTVE